MPDQFTVICEDGRQRHAAPFSTRREADHFAEWGHCCTRSHTITASHEDAALASFAGREATSYRADTIAPTESAADHARRQAPESWQSDPDRLTLLVEHAKGRCTLCDCTARAASYGFRVCSYHAAHGEDDAPCPVCALEREQQ